MNRDYEFRQIALDKIVWRNGRIRGERALRVEALAADIKANGQLQPVLVVELENGDFDLDDGYLRVEALRALKHKYVDARVTKAGAISPAEQRLRGLMANLNRDDYTALERAEALAGLKADYDALYPETKKGGDKGNQYTGGKKRQNEIFSFSQKAAEMMGVDRRSIELAIALFNGLSDATKARVHGTELEKKQADLRVLSLEDDEMQAKALELYFEQKTLSIGDAIILAKGGKIISHDVRLYMSAESAFKKLSKKQRANFIQANIDEIRKVLKEFED